MIESDRRRNAIVKRLLSLNLSTQSELRSILQLASAICRTSAVFISLLDKDRQYLPVSLGIDKEYTDIEDSICRYTILQDEIMEIADIWLDERFAHKGLKVGNDPIRFYAGAPLRTQCGVKLGSLCIVDTEPGALTGLQKNCLQILARQVINILEFESSLTILKEEIEKVQDSEMKLRSIFQSSPDQYILIGRDLKIKALNKTAVHLSQKLNPRAMQEGDDFLSFVNTEVKEEFLYHFKKALHGEHVVSDKKISYGNKGSIWWQARYSPVYNHLNEIIGVSINVTDITSLMKDKEDILTQNEALKKIAQMQSHEMRRPVANIIGLAGMLNNKTDEDFDLYLSYLNQEVMNLDEKIHQIVKLSVSPCRDIYGEC